MGVSGSPEPGFPERSCDNRHGSRVVPLVSKRPGFEFCLWFWLFTVVAKASCPESGARWDLTEESYSWYGCRTHADERMGRKGRLSQSLRAGDQPKAEVV